MAWENEILTHISSYLSIVYWELTKLIDEDDLDDLLVWWNEFVLTCYYVDLMLIFPFRTIFGVGESEDDKDIQNGEQLATVVAIM